MKVSTVFILVFLCYVVSGQSKLKLRLENNLDHTGYNFIGGNTDIANVYEYGLVNKATISKGTTWKLKGEVKSLLNSQNADRSRIFLNQLYATFNYGTLNIKLGKQTLKWGNLPGVSSLDLANVYDYFDFIESDDDELGSWGVDAKLALRIGQLKLRVFPSTQSSRLYYTENNWLQMPTEIALEQGGSQRLPVSFSGLRNLEKVNRAVFGLEYGATFFNTDFKLSYYNGINDIPLASPEVIKGSELPLLLFINTREHRLGILALSASKLFGDWTLSTELSRVQNHLLDHTGDVVDDNYGLVSIGVDRLFLFEDMERMLKVMYQHRFSYSHNLTYTPSDLDHVLDHSSILDIDFTASYKMGFKNRVVISHRNAAFMWSPVWTYKITDNLHVSTGMQLLGGSEGHFFGLHSDKTRILSAIKIML